MKREILKFACYGTGMTCIAIGLYLIYMPLAVIFVGVMLMTVFFHMVREDAINDFVNRRMKK